MINRAVASWVGGEWAGQWLPETAIYTHMHGIWQLKVHHFCTPCLQVLHCLVECPFAGRGGFEKTVSLIVPNTKLAAQAGGVLEQRFTPWYWRQRWGELVMLWRNHELESLFAERRSARMMQNELASSYLNHVGGCARHGTWHGENNLLTICPERKHTP